MSSSSSFKTKNHYKCRNSSLFLLSISLSLSGHSASGNDWNYYV